MRRLLLPEWLHPWLLVFGHDDGDEDEDETEEESEEESEEDDDDDDDNDSDDEDEKTLSEKDVANLRKALKTERAERRKLRKELREEKARKAKEAKDTKDKKDKSDTDKANQERDEANSKAAKLAERLVTNAIDTEIIKAVGSKGLEFRDVDDAIRLVNREDIDVDQDEEDPSDIDLDTDSVKEALKELAKKKPHLLKSKDSDDEDEDEQDTNAATGSKFGGRKKKRDPLGEDALRDIYPALGPKRS